jgi:hypothetical protein
VVVKTISNFCSYNHHKFPIGQIDEVKTIFAEMHWNSNAGELGKAQLKL